PIHRRGGWKGGLGPEEGGGGGAVALRNRKEAGVGSPSRGPRRPEMCPDQIGGGARVEGEVPGGAGGWGPERGGLRDGVGRAGGRGMRCCRCGRAVPTCDRRSRSRVRR